MFSFLTRQPEILKNRYFKKQVRWVPVITPYQKGREAMGPKVASMHKDGASKYPLNAVNWTEISSFLKNAQNMCWKCILISEYKSRNDQWKIILIFRYAEQIFCNIYQTYILYRHFILKKSRSKIQSWPTMFHKHCHCVKFISENTETIGEHYFLFLSLYRGDFVGNHLTRLNVGIQTM